MVLEAQLRLLALGKTGETQDSVGEEKKTSDGLLSQEVLKRTRQVKSPWFLVLENTLAEQIPTRMMIFQAVE